MSTKSCPLCEEVIPAVALQCPECGKRIAGAGTRAEFRKRLLTQELVLRQALRDGAFPRAIAEMGGRLRRRTLLFAAGPLAGGAGLLLGLLGPDESPLRTWDWAILIGTLAALLLFACALIDDLMLPAASARTTPARGLRAFLQALKLKRHAYAYNCVLPGDKNKRVRRRYSVQVTGARSGKFTFSDLKGFRAYWQPVFHPVSAEASMDFSEVKVLTEAGDFALVGARLSAKRRAGGWGGGLLGMALRGLMSKGQDIEIAKLLRCVEGQWYLVNGEMSSPEDDAVGELNALGAASDAELVEMSKTVQPASPS